jgi:Uma2 family endonuclease
MLLSPHVQRDEAIMNVPVPPDIRDLDSFRRWARSSACPEKGRFEFIGGEVQVDLSPEPLWSHNQVRGACLATLHGLARQTDSGLYLSAGVLLSNPAAGFAVVPDGMFVSYDALEHGRVREMFDGKRDGVELEGSPEVVIEIVSDISEVRDTERMPGLYCLAGIDEFWRIDARGSEIRFELMHRGQEGYVFAPDREGWQFSQEFEKWFRFDGEDGPLGHPWYALKIRD